MGTEHESLGRSTSQNGVGDAERAEFLALFERYRDDIVEAD
jgi:hemoglobin